MDYLTTATGKLVSTNCLFFQMKKERDEKLNDVKNRVKKLFIYYHQEALLNPIIEAIIENVFVFGQSQYSANSFNLLNVDEKKRRLPQKRRFRRIRSCKTYEDDESTEISSLSSLDEHEVENSSTRSVKVVSLKLKRLSVTKENKDDAHLRSLKKVKARCDELMESLFPEKLPSAVIVDPIVEKIADRAWFQFKVRQWRRDQEETDSEESCDVTSDCQDEDESFAVVDPLIQQIVDHARIRGKFRLCRQKIADGLIESVISSSSSSSLLTAEEANESIIDHETDEDFDLPQLRLEEKMNMYLNRYQPETENAAMQTATEEDGPVLLITGVPNSYSSIDSAAKILKKHGTLTELKVKSDRLLSFPMSTYLIFPQ